MTSPTSRSEIVLMDVGNCFDEDDLFGGISAAAVAVDDTLLDDHQRLSPKTLRSMKRFERHVGPIIISTTRPRVSAQKALRADSKQPIFTRTHSSKFGQRKRGSFTRATYAFNLDCRPGVYCNGAVIVGSDGSVIHESFFDSTIVVKCMEWILGRRNAGKSSNAPCFLSGDKLYVVDSGSDSFVAAVARDYFHLETEELGEFWVREIYNPRQPSAEIKVSLMFVTVPEEELRDSGGAKIIRALQTICGRKAEVYQLSPTIICIQQAGVTKGTALAKLFEMDDALKARANNVMTVGASSDDIDMITSSKVGVAMENSSMDLLNFADVVTSSNLEYGAKRVLDLLTERAKRGYKRDSTKTKIKYNPFRGRVRRKSSFKNIKNRAVSGHYSRSTFGIPPQNASAEHPSPPPSITGYA